MPRTAQTSTIVYSRAHYSFGFGACRKGRKIASAAVMPPTINSVCAAVAVICAAPSTRPTIIAHNFGLAMFVFSESISLSKTLLP